MLVVIGQHGSSGSLSAELSAPEATAAPSIADIKGVGGRAKLVGQAFGSCCIAPSCEATRIVWLSPNDGERQILLRIGSVDIVNLAAAKHSRARAARGTMLSGLHQQQHFSPSIGQSVDHQNSCTVVAARHALGRSSGAPAGARHLGQSGPLTTARQSSAREPEAQRLTHDKGLYR